MSLHYTIKPIPSASTFLVDLEFDAQDEVVLRLPAWLPGSYMIRDMAAEIQSLRVTAGRENLFCQKIDKSSWRVAVGTRQRKIRVRYEVFAQDCSVRRAYLDTQRAFLMFSSLCVCPVGFEEESVKVTVIEPGKTQGWKVATALNAEKISDNGFGDYHATNYDELIDSPMELGPWQSIEFKAHGVSHRIILSGKIPPFDQKRLSDDVKRAVETVIDFFEPETHEAPFTAYTFFLNLTENLYGGLEHRASTALIASYQDLPIKNEKESSLEYAKLLELFTHEYFHAWWVKRVRPSVFIPYDLSEESYTRLLWVFEGFTSYYDALLTARSGAISKENYLKILAQTFARHLSGSAKSRQSLADSSFDAWIKYYKVRTNRSRSVTSYYDKGALIALALDAQIRKKTKGERALDDVLRLAWKQYKDVGMDYAGLDEEVMPELILDATGVDLTEEMDRWVYGCEEPDYKTLLKVFGVTLKEKAFPMARSILQAQIKGDLSLKVTQLDENGAAEKAGLCVDDELVAIDCIRVQKNNFEKLLTRYKNEKDFSIHVFRGGLLKEFLIQPEKVRQTQPQLSAGGSKAFKKWLAN